jgi:transcriptional regulator with XRE-family HTH domain
MPFREVEVEPEVREALREIGREVRQLRPEWGRSQRAVERVTGIDQTTISRLENGLAPTLRLERLARIRAASRGWVGESRARFVPAEIPADEWMSEIPAMVEEGGLFVGSADDLTAADLAYPEPEDPELGQDPVYRGPLMPPRSSRPAGMFRAGASPATRPR